VATQETTTAQSENRSIAVNSVRGFTFDKPKENRSRLPLENNSYYAFLFIILEITFKKTFDAFFSVVSAYITRLSCFGAWRKGRKSVAQRSQKRGAKVAS
jgi:hypothetical protein